MVVNRIAIPKTHRDEEGCYNTLYGPVYWVIDADNRKMHGLMSDEAKAWCAANLRSTWRLAPGVMDWGGIVPLPQHIHIEFDDPVDAVFFALRWVG